MPSPYFAYALLLSLVVVSYSDWLFAGDVWMRFYRIHPASWRAKAEGFRDGPAIAGSIALALVTCVVMLGLLHCANRHGYRDSTLFALMVWLVAPAPLLFTQFLWMKYPWQLAGVHSLGWLVKLEVVAVAYSLFML